MKLSEALLVLVGSAKGASWTKCEKIEGIANLSEDGLNCDDDFCALSCADGYSPSGPKKARCEKNDEGEFEWHKELGACVSCKDINGIEDEKISVACKINSKKQRVCNLNCPTGTLFNGKEGKTIQKLICKCNKQGKCKWKNQKNKKVSGAKYRAYFCEGDAEPTEKPEADGPENEGDPTEKPETEKPGTEKPETDKPTGSNDKCFDSSSPYGITENSNGTGGCAPDLTSYLLINSDHSNKETGADPHMYMGTHIGNRYFVTAGAGLEKEAEGAKHDAILNAVELCPKMSDYGNPTGTYLTAASNGNYKCKKNFKWSFRTNRPNKSEKFGYVAASPDGSFVIASGMREGKKLSGASAFEIQRYLVKIDAQTGALVWEIKMPTTDAMIKNRAGYESVQFTEDGGFVVGGFARYGGGSEFPYFKSSGAVDDAAPIIEKFGPDVANANTPFTTAPTPQWTYMCHKKGTQTDCAESLGSIKSMRVFKEDGVEKVIGLGNRITFIILNTSDGSVSKYVHMKPPNNTNEEERTAIPTEDSNTDVEVEMKNGKVTGFVVTGIHAGTDRDSAGCAENGNINDELTGGKACASIEGHITKWNKDLTEVKWQTVFNDFTGGVGEYAGLTPISKTLVLTECWGLAKIPTGYVAACGQGMEGCDQPQLASSLIDKCKAGDPRGNWRGTAVAVGFDGAIDWYRMDNYDEKHPESNGKVDSSAYEWVSYNGDLETLMFTGDESMGFAYSTIDLSTVTSD